MSNAVTAQHNKFNPHLLFWCVFLAAIMVFIGIFKAVLLPFVLGIAVAYLLDPVVEKITCKYLPRWAASALILLVFYVSFTVALLLALPHIATEAKALAQNIPNYLDHVWGYIKDKQNTYLSFIDEDAIAQLKQAAEKNSAQILKVGSNLFTHVINGGSAIINLASLFVLAPIISFFMMKDWDNMVDWIDRLIPRSYYKTVKQLQSDINTKISGFVRGQILIAFTLGLIYAFALLIAGLNYGILIGFVAGLLSIIPLLGSITGLIISVAVAWFQSGDLIYMAVIAAIFLVGQFVEGNILTPKFLGKNVGMHPLWILFSIMAGAQLYGILGMLIAVPIAASAAILINFALSEYQKSAFFKQNASPEKAGSKTAKKTAGKTTRKKAANKKTATKKAASKSTTKKSTTKTKK